MSPRRVNVDAIPGSDVHAQLGDGAVDGLPVAEVTLLHGQDPGGDAHASAAVTQPFEPESEDFGLEDLDHSRIVSTRIRLARAISRLLGRGGAEN